MHQINIQNVKLVWFKLYKYMYKDVWSQCLQILASDRFAFGEKKRFMENNGWNVLSQSNFPIPWEYMKA